MIVEHEGILKDTAKYVINTVVSELDDHVNIELLLFISKKVTNDTEMYKFMKNITNNLEEANLHEIDTYEIDNSDDDSDDYDEEDNSDDY